MVFSSPIFLFLFLPVVLLGLAVPGLRRRNLWLLIFSILFYAWGEVLFVFLMLGSTLVNYFLGHWVEKETDAARRKWAAGVAIALNIGTLAFFKYANFAVENLNALLATAGLRPLPFGHVPLPIGISFFTFHALSYVIDIYRRTWPAAKNPGGVALYIFFFPQLIAGPILRWNAIAPQIAQRVATAEKFAEGIRRFIIGLAKKVIIANTVAFPADQIFGLPTRELSPALAWLGTLCYTLQIYFDFSGYSDMAVGLGKMFGFEFMENFNYPYISQSIKDFWRRWHISLSSWFRDYLYIPLGGNRCSEKRGYLNLLIVFFLCGLWHGASWTFVIWGLYHGLFLVLERLRFGQAQESLWRPLRHVYTLLVVMVGWVLFRAGTFAQAVAILKSMAGIGATAATHPIQRYLTNQVACAIVLGVIFSMPLLPALKTFASRTSPLFSEDFRALARTTGGLVESVCLISLLILSATWLAGGTYNPFIYFKF
jgi:alginate O-acetyltransferase complex protein AlgI